MAIKIKQINEREFIVNGKTVDTGKPRWGRNLETFEYHSLQEFRRSIKAESYKSMKGAKDE